MQRAHPPTQERSSDSPTTGVFQSRVERKYLVRALDRRSWIDFLDRHLPRQLAPAGSALAAQYQTSVYFDTDRRELFHAARCGLPVTQVRVRAYQPQPPPPGAERGPASARCDDASSWLELKTKSAGRVEKSRVALSRLGERRVSQLWLGLAPSDLDVSALDAARGHGLTGRAAVAGHPGFSAGAVLRPDSVVSYLRHAWQNDAGTLRVTLDAEVAFHAPRAHAWCRGETLCRAALGPPRSLFPSLVLEIKQCGERPGWLDRRLCDLALESVEMSKFLFASSAVHGERPAAPSMRQSA